MASSSSLPVHPHIYKKGKTLNLKQLSEDKEQTGRRYTFSGTTGSVTTVIHSCNNLNQITGRCLLGIFKLLSYFGLSRDPSEQLSKAPTVYGAFPTFFRREGGVRDELEEIKKLLSIQNTRIERIEDKINHLNPIRNNIPISRTEVLDFTSKLTEIEDHLRKIL